MLSKIFSAAVEGIEAVPIIIETDIRCGMPTFNIVGQADTSVKEARERIRAAVYNSGMEYPGSRITINLSPACIPKKGSHLDLAMAVGILKASGQIFDRDIDSCCFLGELSLDGSLQPGRGILPMVLAARHKGMKDVVVPRANVAEALLVKDIAVYGAETLKDVVDHFNLIKPMEKLRSMGICRRETSEYTVDFADVKGQEAVKRALSIAVAGGHDIFMTGSPSTGKTMLAERLPTIMPAMTDEEILETTVIYSVAGLLDEKTPYIDQRPFRQPHHKITPAALLGGGVIPRPGEITLANNGVLFLDEAGEFSRNLIDGLRTPLEKKFITIARRGMTYTFPADFMLVAASNPCKCGYYQDPFHPCICTPREIMQYQSRLSGPILERIDMHYALTPVDYGQLQQENCLSSAEMRAEIKEARALQRMRYRGEGICLNQQLSGALLEKYCLMEKEAAELMGKAYHRMKLNPRTLNRVRRVARTIADLEKSPQIEAHHLSEALSYRERI